MCSTYFQDGREDASAGVPWEYLAGDGKRGGTYRWGTFTLHVLLHGMGCQREVSHALIHPGFGKESEIS
jgi:hypothetical protein